MQFDQRLHDTTYVLSIMTLEYNTRAKKDSAVTSESLQNLEDNIIKTHSAIYKNDFLCITETYFKRQKYETNWSQYD